MQLLQPIDENATPCYHKGVKRDEQMNNMYIYKNIIVVQEDQTP